MTEEIKVLKGISKGGETYDIDAKYWNGESSIKTINGQSLFGSGDITIPDEVELIEISGDMLADEPIYTAAEVQAIIDAYNANKLIAIKCEAKINFGKGWFIPNISIRTQSGGSQIFLSGILGNYYIEHSITYNQSAGTVSTIAMSFIDLSEIGGSSTYAYGTCDTAAGTGTKVVDLTDSNFTVSTGSIVAVKFTYANSVATTLLKLSVGDVTAQIKYLNTTFPSNQHWTAGSVVEFIYDGTAWQVLGNIKDNAHITQTITTTNSTYPILFSATANKSTSSADAARFSTSFKYNPSTDTLTVGNITGTATNANILNTLNTIDGVNYNGSADVSHYVTCSDAGTTTAKTVAHSAFKLVTGARVSVKFIYDQSSATSGPTIPITLKVGNTTAKGMYYKGNAINGSNLIFKSGLIYDFIYDGTNWVLQGEWALLDPFTPITYGTINGITYDGRTDISNYVICDTAADVIVKELTVPNIELTSGTVLYVKFTNGSTSTKIQFKINDGSRSNVKLRGESSLSLAGYNINNLDYYKFIFDGSVWWLMPNDIPVIVEISTANYNSTTSGNTLHTGVYYKFTSTASTSMNLTSIDPTTKQSFTMEITTGTSAPTITFPSTWKWVNGVFPVFEANKTYQISTFNNCAVCASFSTAS